ncbi:MAG: PQQ-binding-like beta-propeller repeat protein [Candidatus Hydrogenedentes bacterium]|nr:PQQ-binding-like beta-propeller repeat protein [Candidatus Hydrogenedentota bacterium]
MTRRTVLRCLAGLGLILAPPSAPADGDNQDWPAYLGGLDSAQYSSLDQITPENAANLEVAWTYASEGGNPERLGQIQCNPLVIDGVLYGVSPWMKVFALDAATGAERWTFTPENPTKAVCRGFGWWTDGARKRLLYAGGPHLYALDAETGQPVEGFGEQGRVDLSKGLGRDGDGLYVSASSPGVVYRDLYILGFRTNESHPASPGHIRAFNVHTGAIEWIFHTIPQPGEFGHDTWPEGAHERAGGANSWAGMSLDPDRGIVYVPTGSAVFDFHGGDRHGDNLFANTLLALDAATGERKWHFQAVRHDLWDRDLPAPPNLMTVTHGGKTIDAVAQITKSAYVFLFDRETGEPLFPIEDMPAPPSDLEGERAAASQPVPVKPPPFSRHKFGFTDITDVTPESREFVMKRWDVLRKGHPFHPPSREGTLIFPGFDGGGEWGGAAADPESGILYVSASEMPWVLQMVDINALGSDPALQRGAMVYAQQCLFCHGVNREGNAFSMFPPLRGIGDRLARADAETIMRQGKGFMPAFPGMSGEDLQAVLDYVYQADAAGKPGAAPGNEGGEKPAPEYRHTGWNRFVDHLGYPAIKPPWGTLNAIDMNTGEIVWKLVLGDTPALRERGLPQTGAENYGGPVVTKGGVIFIGATKDEMFHVYDKSSGALLWEARLPAGGYATPSVYAVDGVQYVVIAAAGGKMGTKEGDAYVAFRLGAVRGGGD